MFEHNDEPRQQSPIHRLQHPQQRSDRYASVKKLCCIDMPVASQVILQKTLSNPKRQVSVVQKVALQINCKLGGQLWGIKSNYPNVMCVGIDSFHNTTGQGRSVAGFVASMNDWFGKWYSITCHQVRRGRSFLQALYT